MRAGMMPGQTIMHYRVLEGGRIAWYSPDGVKLKRAIESKDLAGRLQKILLPDGHMTIPVITASRRDLVAYLRTRGPGALFLDKPSVFERVRGYVATPGLIWRQQ